MGTSSEDWCQMKPGKPCLQGDPSVSTIQLKWEVPITQSNPSIKYELRYKIMTGADSPEWCTYKERLCKTNVAVDNLRSGSRFVFKVRMIDKDNKKSKFSGLSDMIETLQSAANLMFHELVDVSRENEMVPIKGLTFEVSWKDPDAKTRTLVFGEESRLAVKEKTIMIIGATGTGKTTLVNAMINYIFGVSWEDPFRLAVGNLEPEEEQAHDDETVSQTVWITCYTIHPRKGSIIPYKLNIIDTPGYGHVEGIEEDRRITGQIQNLFTEKGKKGIRFVDAVCIVVKASDARLTKTQDYIFKSIKSIFQKDIIENLCILLTFSDWQPPKVLGALMAVELPVDKCFSFNNSALYANNKSEDSLGKERSMLDWRKGCEEFAKFFQELDKLASKSLALSEQVLIERSRIEITIENLRLKLSAAVKMRVSGEKQLRLIKENAEEIELNKHFTFFVDDTFCTKKAADAYNLNCNICKETCHMKCWTFNYTLSIWTCAVFKHGYCTQCHGKCPAGNHRNEKQIYEYETRSVPKVYGSLIQQYEEALQKKLKLENVLDEMQQDIAKLNSEIQEMVDTIQRSNNRLKEIALCDDPLSVETYYDLLIQEERIIKKPGWLDRIGTLRKFKRKVQEMASIYQDAKQTSNDMKAVNKFSTFRKKLIYLPLD